MFQPTSPEYLTAELTVRADRIRGSFLGRLVRHPVQDAGAAAPTSARPRSQLGTAVHGRSRVRAV